MSNSTMTGGTLTARGTIPHKRVSIGGLSFLAPVALEYTTGEDGQRKLVKSTANLPYPRQFRGNHVYALPGGFYDVGPGPTKE